MPLLFAPAPVDPPSGHALEALRSAEARSTQATALLRAVVELGNGLGLTVVAEGVERQDQLALVRGVGCGLGQGWLWARPMSLADVATLLGP